MNLKQIFKLSFVPLFLLILCSCGLVEMSGTMTKKTGEVMEDYSQDHDGFIGKMSGFGGKINTAVGSTVEDIAQQGSSENSEKSKPKQFAEANKKVLNSAFDSVKEKNTLGNDIILQAQTKLQTLGYDPGSTDGIMGNKTKQAIGKYQQAENLNITNSLDKQTLSALNLDSTE